MYKSARCCDSFAVVIFPFFTICWAEHFGISFVQVASAKMKALLLLYVFFVFLMDLPVIARQFTHRSSTVSLSFENHNIFLYFFFHPTSVYVVLCIVKPIKWFFNEYFILFRRYILYIKNRRKFLSKFIYLKHGHSVPTIHLMNFMNTYFNYWWHDSDLAFKYFYIEWYFSFIFLSPFFVWSYFLVSSFYISICMSTKWTCTFVELCT